MKKIMTIMVAGSIILTAISTAVAEGHNGGQGGGSHGSPSPHQGHQGGYGGYYGGYGGDHHHGDSGWAVAGQIMTGVLIGSIFQRAYYASEPPRREVVYYTRPVYQPAPVRYVQPPPVVYTQPAYQPAPTQYSPPPAVDARPNTSMVTAWVLNSNGSRTLVALRKTDNGQYIGPNGEYYTGFPTNEQLRQLYGM